jgi:hypothetical protein
MVPKERQQSRPQGFMLPVDVSNQITWVTPDVLFAEISIPHVMKRRMRSRIRYGCDCSANIIGANAIVLKPACDIPSNRCLPDHRGATYENHPGISHTYSQSSQVEIGS